MKKLLSLLLAVMMVVCLCPITAWAEEESGEITVIYDGGSITVEKIGIIDEMIPCYYALLPQGAKDVSVMGGYFFYQDYDGKESLSLPDESLWLYNEDFEEFNNAIEMNDSGATLLTSGVKGFYGNGFINPDDENTMYYLIVQIPAITVSYNGGRVTAERIGTIDGGPVCYYALLPQKATDAEVNGIGSFYYFNNGAFAETVPDETSWLYNDQFEAFNSAITFDDSSKTISTANVKGFYGMGFEDEDDEDTAYAVIVQISTEDKTAGLGEVKTLGIDGLFTLKYYALSEGSVEVIGTAEKTEYGTTYSGKAYRVTLPVGTVTESFSFEREGKYKAITAGSNDGFKKIPSEAQFLFDGDFIEDNTRVVNQRGAYITNVLRRTSFEDGKELDANNVTGFGAYILDDTDNSYNTIFVQIAVQPDEDNSMTGSGTKDDPYIIAKSEDLSYISEKVNSGQKGFYGTYFKFSDDVESITLPDNWTPIGQGDNLFGGNINGNGKTLIVPKNSLSLIGAPLDCTIENLNIYGEKIPGYGLVEGYTTYCTGTIKNITIKSGSHILKSGLIGGYGNESVNIYDCTIEKGVVIGDDGTWGDLGDTSYTYDWVSDVNGVNHQDMIGSFCGAWNGTITNCVSYATVYGRNYVGGIVGFKGQSMRKCFINNCAFYGDIIATGEGVGGIVGSGYLAGSAPNSPCVTIENCYATGNIKGKNKVGGIFGGELGVSNNWGNGIGRVRGNYFSGTVTATGENAYVGGVIGYMKSMDIYNDVRGNYFVDDCGAANGIGKIDTVYNADKVSYNTYVNYGRNDDPMTSELVTKKVTRAQVTNGELVKLLNSGKYGRDNWQQGSEYPVFGEGKHIIGITSINSYDDSVKSPLETNPPVSVSSAVGYEALYERQILVKYSDGTQEIISASEGEFGGVDFTETKKVQLASLTYGNYELTFGAQVYKPATGNIKVSLQVLGDSVHGENGEVHTLKNGNLTEWFPMTEFDDVPNNYTVWNFINKKLTAKGVGMKLTNSDGNYISAITYNGVTLSAGANGENSCWQFTINGVNSALGVAQQDLSDGDVIVLYYTDDYTKENPTASHDEVKNVIELIDAIGTVTKDSSDAIKAARNAYDKLTDGAKTYVDNYDALVKAEKVYGMIVDSNKPDASDKGDKTGSIIKISATAAAKGEENPNTGAPVMSIAPAMLVLAAAVLVLKKRG